MRRAIVCAVLCVSLVSTSMARSDGWATGGGVTGMVLSTVSVGLGLGALIAKEADAPTAVPSALGGVSLVVLGIDVPLVAVSGATARSKISQGVVPLRILSWVCYAATLGCGTAMIITGVAGGEVPTGLIIPTVIVEGVSGYGMAIDALVSGAQARNSAFAPSSPVRLSLAPAVGGGVVRLTAEF